MKKENPTVNLNNVENLPLPNFFINPWVDNNSGEKKAGKKLTIPDQGLTIKQILERHTRGQRTPDAIAGYYDGENDPLGLDGTNIETLDLSQKYDILEQVRKNNARLKSRANREKQENYNENLRKQGEERAKKVSTPETPQA